ncbi:MAG: hypothetical protein BWY66_01612 [bacterium ADurb.Bin374]|nr:MAG: hypothetical protein BWY66_01612 [bacterium ADurb.Bin374]
MIFPRPGITATSIGRIVPPTSVQARPVTTPISSFSSFLSMWKVGTPRYDSMLSADTTIWPIAACAASSASVSFGAFDSEPFFPSRVSFASFASFPSFTGLTSEAASAGTSFSSLSSASARISDFWSFTMMLRATFRPTAASSRSRLRTPASRVYLRMTSMMAASWTVISYLSMPFASSCFGTRYFFAIWTFSSSV